MANSYSKHKAITHSIMVSLAVLAMAFLPFALSSCRKKANASTSKYVASTSWVAAIADMAGIEDITIIAPPDLTHPPEYEITASDIAKISASEIFFHAGYEKMMETIKSSLELPEERSVKVRTQNKISVLEDNIRKIIAITKTEETAMRNLEEYKKMIEEGRGKIKAKKLDRLPALVNVNQVPLAEDLGLNIAGTFGPGPLTSGQIEMIARNKYPIIVDNIHNPVIKNIEDLTPGSHIIVWRNFPEKPEKGALMKLVKENISKML